ncbi:MAG: Hsp20/alpha crystallin family protein [Treponema sp.]|nr:Hsp20/alpha crystallin family protein [Treponema sp.]
MKGTRGYTDLGNIFDEIFEAARNFHDEFRKNFNATGCGPGQGEDHPWVFDESVDYYPSYSYPPMNAYMTADRSLVFEFALAGFDEKDLSLSFQGDYMAFSAAIPRNGSPDDAPPPQAVRYFKRRLKMKDIEKQKYYVPQDKYAQDKVKAVFRNGILRVSIPPKDEPDTGSDIRIDIVTGD